jgi:hypothetical protein
LLGDSSKGRIGDERDGRREPRLAGELRLVLIGDLARGGGSLGCPFRTEYASALAPLEVFTESRVPVSSVRVPEPFLP